MNCKYCKADCARRGEDREKECRGYIPMTNADRIRAMSDEELAKWIFGITIGDEPRSWCDFHCQKTGKYGCEKCALEWLKQPAEE